MKIGVLSVQGAVSEHVEMTDGALRDLGRSGSAVVVRRVDQIEGIDSLIIPGGESTTISRLIDRQGLRDSIIKRGQEGMPIMGTCAGCVLMARAGDDDVERTDTKLLSLMDMKVVRNAFGGQRESFEAELDTVLFEEPFHGVFIRAPAMTEVWEDCAALARLDEHVVMAGQADFLAVAFHPELSGDSRIHRYFLDL
ncbi:MAG: pyridoxal 5'-phosphate synthase glutaminase subunit PdxT [Thermoplasmata archaeon]|nr:pyridoxal 5'-phosphate synthase glutaminase subunit PdxT [Thermoplasmata archaeon]